MRRVLIVVFLTAACGGTGAQPGGSASPPLAAGSQVATPTAIQASSSQTPRATEELSWGGDLALIDKEVRRHHPGPFTNHSEAEWNAKLAELAQTLPAATSKDEELVLFGSLVALLDTHSWIEPAQPSRAYPVYLYQFAEGWFVIGAQDQALIGTRLVSINGSSAADLETKFRSLVAFDNESGALDGMQGLFSYQEWLHGAGVVDDVDHPNYVFETADGDELRPDMRSLDLTAWLEILGINGGLIGDGPEAVARRGERIWTRLDEERKVMLVSVNDYGDVSAAINEIRHAVDGGHADRVVMDMRYLRGGSGDMALVDLLKADPRINSDGALSVLIGRENVSAATRLAHWLDSNTRAVFVGEETPARADGFLCDCFEIRLPYSRHLVIIPTWTGYNGDDRDSIPPDFPMLLHADDFFAGRDPVLDAALNEDTI